MTSVWTIMNGFVQGLHLSLPNKRNILMNMISSILVCIFVQACLVVPVFSQNINEFPPTMFTQQPLAGSAELRGNTKVLLCDAMGLPVPVYRWKKDGVYMTSENITETRLKIQNIQREDAGLYQCVASNAHGAILSNEVLVQVAYMVPFANAGNQEQSVDQGQARIIELPPIESYPEPSIRWFEGFGRPVPTESQRYHVSLRNQLVILETRLQSDNNNLYKATALNSYTGHSSDSQTFVLNVQNVGSLNDDIPPAIVIPPMPTTAVQGDDVSVALECVANARPLNYLRLRWFKINRSSGARTQIEPDNVKYLLTLYRRKLTIKNPVIDDSGVYECEAVFERPGSDSLPPVSARANLTVLVKPNFATPPPSEINQDVDTRVVIRCQAVGSAPLRIRWFRDAVPVESLKDTRFSVLENGNLQIEDTIPSDTGMYQCFVSNQVGSINAATWVKVLSSKPEIVQGPHNQTIVAGESARFPCEVTGAPKPTIVWTRVNSGGATEVLPGINSRIQVLDKELLIPVSEVSDTGHYTCNASNSQGIEVASAFLKVTLRTRIVAPPQGASIIKGSSTILQCSVTHDPSVIVYWHWYHNENEIPADDARRQVDRNGNLDIKSVRNSDIGTYSCYVTSMGGNDSASADIRVIELPHSPFITSVVLNPESNRAVDVSWSPGFDGNSPIKKYIVQYRLVPADTALSQEEGWKVADNNQPPTARLYTVHDLQPARTYQFRVSAVNDVGEGNPSVASNPLELPQQPPSGPPRGVVGSPRSNSSIIIQWQPPDDDKWNGALLGYSLRYKPASYPDSTLDYENITNYIVTMYELKSLIVFQEYEIAVAAYNKKGVGVYSNYVRVRTQEGSPTAPPTDVQAVPINSTMIKVTWMPPDPQYINGINQGYKIYAERTGATGPTLQVTVPSDTSNMLGLQTGFLQNLMKFSEYKIRILCFTSRGDGPLSSMVSAVTLEDVPDQVGDLRFDNILDTSLRVLWTPPANINGILTGYTLSYMRKNQTITKVTKELSPTYRNYTITGLTATTTYTIEVYAETRVGAGPPRSADIASGVPPVKPDPPRNLALTNIQATTVLLQFVPGFSGYTSISRWIIEAQTNNNDQGPWGVIYEINDPDAVALTVKGLRPYTPYRLRMIAENIADRSTPSEPTRWFETIQAPPAMPPADVTVRATNETAMRVRWTPLTSVDWNGEERGYLIQYRAADTTTNTSWTFATVPEENANSFMLGHLEEWTSYHIRVSAYNKVGSSDYSPVVIDTTREAVPSAGPSNVSAIAVNSTTIHVTWGEVPKIHQNGLIRGYKVKYLSIQENIPEAEVNVNSNFVFEAYLQDLRKFVWYDIQVLAFTRIGDGVLSVPAFSVRTDEDKPGPPSGVYFPEVTNTAVQVVWEPPREPNGIITGYRVAYGKKADAPNPQRYVIVDDTLDATRKDYEVINLERNTYYMFAITAKTRLGWGRPAELEVYTIVNRRVPDAPSQPRFGLSQIGDRSVTISWTPGNNGYGPVRNYTIQVQKNTEAFYTVPDYIPADALEHNITGLQPNTRYKFRIAASNDLGLGPYSSPSDEATTKQAAPESPPLELQVKPLTTSSVLVTWKPPPEVTWNGHLMGYHIEYREVDAGFDWRSETLFNAGLKSITIYNLHLFKTYEFKIRAFNSLGQSDWSPQTVIYLEIVPTASPENVKAETLSSTQIKLSWDPPPQDAQNGDLLGYKVFYWVTGNKDAASMQTVAPSDQYTVLADLEMYTEYAAIILAYNAAGDGPNTTVPVVVRTSEGVPGPPRFINFVVVELNAVNVSWTEPQEPNGLVEMFEISYFMDNPFDGESRSVQVKLSGDKHSYLARGLTYGYEYVFSVRAKTSLDWGKNTLGNITVKPQPGAPDKPTKPRVSKDKTTLTVVWENGASGDSSITSSIVQSREKRETNWENTLTKNDPEPKAVLNFLNLKAKTEYQFRVMARNDAKGISVPSEPSDFIMTLDVSEEPFYKQWWFLVIVALTGLIFIIIVVSLLCLTGRNKKNKYKDTTIPRATIQLSNNGAIIGEEDGGFTTFELRRSQRASQRAVRPKVPPPAIASTAASASNSIPVYANFPSRSPRIPPRPSPGSVNYNNSDDESKYPEDDESSLSDKPSDLSSSDNNTDSDPDDEKLPPPPPLEFNHRYANGDVQMSWQRQNSQPNPYGAAYAYTDSEVDSSHYGVSLNGGHVIMNNMAGSRAPLPGFSSFV